MNAEKIMAMVEDYRTAGGRVEHAAKKEALQIQLEALSADAERWQTALSHWKSAQLRWSSSGPNIPKGATVVFDFMKKGVQPTELQSFFDEVIRVKKGAAQ